MVRRSVVGRILCVLLALGLVGAPSADATALVGTKARLKRAMQIAGPQAGAVVIDTSTGRELFAHNADVKRVPASVNKLYTTSAALLRLGPAGRLTTDVLATAEPDAAGVLAGDLFLHGGGDPTFTRADMRRLAETVAANGVAEVDGDVLGDETLFDLRRGVPSSNYKPSFYVGVLSALVLDANLDVSKRFVRTPAKTAASVFRNELQRAGVKVRGSVGAGAAPSGAVPIASAESPSIAVIAQATNRPSSNFYAETLLKGLGALQGTGGSTAAGARVVRSTVARFGIAPQIADGSGLSRANRTSPREVARLLTGMTAEPEFLALDSSLPVAGRNGTLVRRMRGTPAQDACHAKTGTLRSVSSLAGYCQTRDGRRLAFAIIQNGVNPTSAHTAQDRLAATLAAADL